MGATLLVVFAIIGVPVTMTMIFHLAVLLANKIIQWYWEFIDTHDPSKSTAILVGTLAVLLFALAFMVMFCILVGMWWVVLT